MVKNYKEASHEQFSSLNFQSHHINSYPFTQFSSSQVPQLIRYSKLNVNNVENHTEGGKVHNKVIYIIHYFNLRGGNVNNLSISSRKGLYRDKATFQLRPIIYQPRKITSNSSS